MSYEDYIKYLNDNSLDKIKITKEYKGNNQKINIKIEKLKEIVTESEFKEINKILEGTDKDYQKLFNKYADEINSIKKVNNGGSYSPYFKKIEFRLNDNNGKAKYSTLFHEYGHFFDSCISKDTFTVSFRKHLEKCLTSINNLDIIIPNKASASDIFIEAFKKDKAEVFKKTFEVIKNELINDDNSAGVQDAISGMYTGRDFVVRWRHTEAYYNRKFNILKDFSEVNNTVKYFKDNNLGIKTQKELKAALREYEITSELWANISSAMANKEEMVYMEKYFPNSVKAFKGLIKIKE